MYGGDAYDELLRKQIAAETLGSPHFKAECLKSGLFWYEIPFVPASWVWGRGEQASLNPLNVLV